MKKFSLYDKWNFLFPQLAPYKNKNRKILTCTTILLLFVSFIFFSCFFLFNEGFYNQTIVKITSITENNFQNANVNGKLEQMKKQSIKGIIMNGYHKGSLVELENTTSYSQVSDTKYKVRDEVFVSLQENEKHQITASKIIDLKRDHYIVIYNPPISCFNHNIRRL